MRPILLKISAFGSYAAEEIIDFTGIEKGIFLITGDTGSGKTTIFDAMTFALFDQTSGGKRDASDMRSQYASPDTPTYVEFTFSIKGEVYRIRRNPRYLRTSKRRDKDGNLKLTSEAPLVELYLPGDVLFTGKMKETNDKIVEIVGIDVNQFTQICMLAQGEFLKLLHASSGMRREIFSRLFHTGLYEQIELKLRAKAKQLDKLLFENESLCIHELAYIKPMQDGQYIDEWAALCENWDGHKNSRYLPMEDIELNLTRIIEEVEGVYRKADREVKCLEDTVRVEGELSKREEALSETSRKIEQIQCFLTENEERITQLEQQRNTARKELDEKQQPLMQEITRLQDAIPKYEKQKEIHIKVRALQEKCRQLGEEISRKGISFLVADTTEELIRQETDLNRELEDFVRKQEELKHFEKNLTAYDVAEKQRKKEQQCVMEQLQAYEECSKEYEQLNASFIRAQVGIIAATLEDKKPCPVCGSTVHPSPAKILDEDVTESRVKEAREKRNKAESLMQDRQRILQQAQIKENTLLTEITKEGESLFEQFVIGKAREQCREARKTWMEQQQGMEECKSLLKLAQEMTSLIDENTVLASQLPKEDYAAARKKFADKKTELDTLQKTLKKTEKDFQELQQMLLQKKGALETAKELLNGLQKERDVLQQQYDMQVMQNQLAGILPDEQQSYTDIFTVAKEKQQKMLLIMQKNTSAFEQIKQLFIRRRELIQQYEIISRLDKTANGNVAGAVKMDFQTFIQRQYFKKIILEANKRLLRMTNQQFILKCKDIEDIGTQGAAGLDLNVYSLVTDSVRDVKTLSGGESFMAALAMALGMSDIISASVGKIQMETMFVDEGFGSLDEESRNQAITILQELAGNNRLIGIISHVSELKEQIENKLIVRKTDKGSAISWSS